MDTYRGLAIFLVVLFHAAGNFRDATGRESVPVLDPITMFFDPYRMPLLLILSGLLLHRGLAKPLGAYFGGKFRKILWPLVVWSSVQLIISARYDDFFSPVEWINGTYQWFLVVLMVCFMVAPLTRWIPAIALAVAFIIILIVVKDEVPESARILFYGSFFFLGAALGPLVPRIQALPVWAPVLLGLIGITIGVCSATELLIVNRAEPWTVLFPLPGLVALLWLGPRLPSFPPLDQIGRNSIIYYTVHTGVLLVTSQIWGAAGWPDTKIRFTVLFIIAIAVPAFLTRYRQQCNLLFEFPTRRQRTTATSASGHTAATSAMDPARPKPSTLEPPRES
ncbi:acyltransferase [Cellulosimicrobium funkei]|nr:acyltransferase [Cellulosimicrobium funkei]